MKKTITKEQRKKNINLSALMFIPFLTGLILTGVFISGPKVNYFYAMGSIFLSMCSFYLGIKYAKKGSE